VTVDGEADGAAPTALEPGDTNAIGRMLGLLGDEWNLLILQQSLMGADRYGHFTTALPVSNSVLSKRLRLLVDEGLLARRKNRYLPTARSRSLWPLLLLIWEWERTWVATHRERLPEMHDERCGELFSALWRCSACGVPVHGDEVELALGPSGQWTRSAPASATRRRSDSQAGERQAGLFPETMAVLGNRWAAALLLAAFLGAARFTDFQAQLGAPPSLLAERLQTFCAIGVLSTQPARPGGSERVHYLLSDKGLAFGAVLAAALQWAQHWFVAPEGPAITLLHKGCGQPFTGELACDRCGERLSGAQVRVTAAAVAGTP